MTCVKLKAGPSDRVSGGLPADQEESRTRSGLESWLQRLCCVGLVWLFVGMAVMPAGVSYNPSRAYQYLLGLTLYLPALLLIVLRPRRFLAFWQRPPMPWIGALLIWGCLSLAWGSAAGRPGDELGRSVSIMLFMYGWTQAIEDHEERIRNLLFGSGIVMAMTALAAMLLSVAHPPVDGRLAAFGVMDNPNLAAAAMAAAALWLCAWPAERLPWRIGQSLIGAVLASFVFMTFSRSVWGALFAALLTLALCHRGRRARTQGAALVLLGCTGAAMGLPWLMQRGWSLRPQILENSWALFLQHPWLGLGQGAKLHMEVAGMVLTHAHNMFSQLAIELGLPGLLLGLATWGALGWRGWHHRHESLGRLVLATWVLATIVVQFDQPHLIDSPRPTWLITWLPLAMSLSLGRGKLAASTGSPA